MARPPTATVPADQAPHGPDAAVVSRDFSVFCPVAPTHARVILEGPRTLSAPPSRKASRCPHALSLTQPTVLHEPPAACRLPAVPRSLVSPSKPPAPVAPGTLSQPPHARRGSHGPEKTSQGGLTLEGLRCPHPIEKRSLLGTLGPHQGCQGGPVHMVGNVATLAPPRGGGLGDAGCGHDLAKCDGAKGGHQGLSCPGCL